MSATYYLFVCNSHVLWVCYYHLSVQFNRMLLDVTRMYSYVSLFIRVCHLYVICMRPYVWCFSQDLDLLAVVNIHFYLIVRLYFFSCNSTVCIGENSFPERWVAEKRFQNPSWNFKHIFMQFNIKHESLESTSLSLTTSSMTVQHFLTCSNLQHYPVLFLNDTFYKCNSF